MTDKEVRTVEIDLSRITEGRVIRIGEPGYAATVMTCQDVFPITTTDGQL